MIENKIRQGIVISGESGAGKTESAKMSMAFLTSLGTKNIDPNKAPMETRILSTNPVLEAFGNSRTARNNNSSRFGKYIKLFFDQEDGKVLGAEIKNYLLEKSRVTGCTDVERNFHVFFFFLRGVSDEYAKKLGFV
jgi:myosin protein heavy chain